MLFLTSVFSAHKYIILYRTECRLYVIC